MIMDKLMTYINIKVTSNESILANNTSWKETEKYKERGLTSSTKELDELNQTI